jgi:lipopolysaccharide export system protein LptA
MSKVFFTANSILEISKKIQKSMCNHFQNLSNQESLRRIFRDSLLISLALICIFTAAAIAERKSIVITSQILTADNKKNVAVFEGTVVAKSDDITINSDKMEVFYDNSEGKIKIIHAYGNVKVFNKERAIFSQEATYFGQEEKIVFTGEPKAVEGENIITGTEIIYFLKDNRTIVKDSRVVLKKDK